MSLLTIVQNALEEVGKFETASTVINNSNASVQRFRQLSQREGYLLARRGRWQELLKTHTFTTTASTDSYSMPADFDRFVDMTWWDRVNYWRVFGPATPNQWQTLKSAIVSEGVRRWFRLQGDSIYIHPTPTVTGDTIAFEYLSSYWVDTDADGVGESATWTADSDTSLLDEELITMGVVWRALRINGLPYAEEFNAYEREVEKALVREGAPAVNLAHGAPLNFDAINVQEGNFPSS